MLYISNANFNLNTRLRGKKKPFTLDRMNDSPGLPPERTGLSLGSTP